MTKYLNRIIYKVLKLAIGKMIWKGLFDDVSSRKSYLFDITSKDIVRGENCVIEPTANIVVNPGSKIVFAGDNYIGRHTEIGTNNNIFIGRGTTIQDRTIILGEIEIGEFCVFAPNIFLSSDIHQFRYLPHLYIRDQDKLFNHSGLPKSNKIVIEDDVWLGINVVVSAGIKVGKGSIVGANSVVTKDVKPYTIVAGVPAKIIGTRLNFEPPSFIQFDTPEHLPYFYKGFYSDLENTKVDFIEGGISASGTFEVCMAKGKEIIVTLKKVSTDIHLIKYFNQEFTIDTFEFVKLVFEANSEEFHRFSSNSLEPGKKFLIKSVEIKG